MQNADGHKSSLSRKGNGNVVDRFFKQLFLATFACFAESCALKFEGKRQWL